MGDIFYGCDKVSGSGARSIAVGLSSLHTMSISIVEGCAYVFEYAQRLTVVGFSIDREEDKPGKPVD